MSSRPLSLFRRSWLSVVGGMSGLMALITLLSFGLMAGSDASRYWDGSDWWVWSQSKLMSWSIGLLVAAVIPWMLLTFFGEWFYTRSLPRRAVFQLVWGEFLRFWAPAALVLWGLQASTQFHIYRSGSEMPFGIVALAATGSLLGGLLLASGTELLRKLGPALGLLAAWVVLFGQIKLAELPVGAVSGWLLWLGLLGWAYRQIAHNQQDLGQDRSVDGDELAPGPMRGAIYRLLGLASQTDVVAVSGWQRSWSKLRLLSEYPRMVYAQLLALGAGAVALAGLLVVRYNFGEIHSQDLPVFYTAMLLYAGLTALMLLAINPRYSLARRWEFLASRPVGPRRIYLAGWIMQGLMVLLVAAGTAGIAALLPEVFVELDFARLGLLTLFLWLGGELAIGVLCLLAAASLTLSPAMSVAALAVLHSGDWHSLLLWGCAIGFRGWDLARFGRWEPAGSPLRVAGRLLLHYLLPGGLLMGAALYGIQHQALARYLAATEQDLLNPNERMNLSQAILVALYSRVELKSPDEYAYEFPYSGYLPQELRRLIARPNDSQAAIGLAQNALDTESLPETDYWRTYRLSPYGYFDKDSSLWQQVHHTTQQARYWLDVAKDSPPAAKLLIRAQLAEVEQDYGTALTLAKQALALDSDPRYAFEVPRIQFQMLRQAQAIAGYRQIAQRSPKLAAAALYVAGVVSEEAGLFKQAVDYYLQAGDASPPLALSKQIGYRLQRLPSYRLGLCEPIMRHFGRPGLSSTTVADDLAACSNQPEHIRDIRVRGQWYLRHGQPLKALESIGADQNGLRAQALWAAGRKDEAVALARANVIWAREQGQVFYYNLLAEDQQLLLQRVLVQGEAKPKLESGLQVLFRSPDLALDWPMLSKAFRGQELVELTRIRQALETLDMAMTAAGQLNAAHYKSLATTRVQLLMSEYLPQELRTPALEAAVRELRVRLQ